MHSILQRCTGRMTKLTFNACWLMIARDATCAAVLMLVAADRVHAQPPSLPQVIARAGEYVREFEGQLSGIVAEETYEQEYFYRRGRSLNPLQQRRTLRADLLLMRPEGELSWVQFRDVFEVDGKPVRDREERLTALFLKPTRSTLERIARIRRESARYNIGNVDRTMNVPVLPLQAIDPAVQPRFRYSLADPARRGNEEPALPNTPSFRVTTEVWVVRYEEIRGPTLVRSPNGEDLRSSGRLWIEPATGRVLMGEVVTRNRDVTARLTVSFQSEPLLGLLVPVEMHEEYRMKDKANLIVGTATYGKFRQFQVTVDQRIEEIW